MASVGYLGAQNLVLQNQETLGKVEIAPEQTPSKADFTLKYYVGTTFAGLGNASFGVGSFYSHGCISFTAPQMCNYAGGTLTQINFYFPSAAQNASLVPSSGKVWIKNTLSGAIVYEQTGVTVTPGAWNNVPLNTPYPLTLGNGLVIGFSVMHTTTSGTTNEIRPMPLTTTGDSYKQGGANYIIGATVPNTHGAGATWNVFTTAGNLGIEGLVTGAPAAPTIDLCASSIAGNPLKWVGNPTTYTVTVFNSGTTSQNNYTVQLLDAANNVIGTTAVTTAVAAGAFANVNVTYTPTAAGNLTVKGKVVLTGDQSACNDVCEPITQKVYAFQPMAYCDNSAITGIGYAPAVPHQAAITYTSANMTPFAGKNLTAIEVAFGVPAATITGAKVWIRSSLTGANLYEQDFTPVDGWNTVVLNTPYPLTTAQIYIGWSATSSVNFIIGATVNTPVVAAGGHIQGGTNNWSNYNAQTPPMQNNNAIIGVVNEASATVTITTNVNPTGAGTVTGGGAYAIGAPVTLTASANAGYTFVNWTPGNSTANPLTFNASVDATYTANFMIGEPGDCNPATNFAVAYSANCMTASLTWEAPISKGKSGVQGFTPLVTPDTPSRDISAKSATTRAIRTEGAAQKRGFQMPSLRGPNTIAYAIDCFPGNNNPATLPLNNPGGLSYIGGALPELPGGGDWIDGEWYCIAPNSQAIYKINPVTGAHTIVANHNVPTALAMCKHPDGTVYVNADGGAFYTVNLATGATTFAFQANQGSGLLSCFAITNDGRFIQLDLANNNIVEVNPNTGAVTTLISFGFNVNFIQDMAIDREANTIYWAAYVFNGWFGWGELHRINLDDNTLTYLGDFANDAEIVGFAIPTESNPNLAKAPTNVTVTPIGTSLNGTLSWTNPTETLGGAPLTITKMVIDRNGQPYTEITTAAPGQNMTLPVTVDNAGQHSFTVYAVTSEGNGGKASASGIFGNVCQAQVVIIDREYGDSFSWTLIDDESGALLAGGGQQVTGSNVSMGTFPALLTGSATFSLWQHGTYTDNGVTLVINVDGEEVYSLSIYNIPSGFSVTEDVFCGGNTYNVYRDNVLLTTTKRTYYDDIHYDSSNPYTWEVRVVCEDGNESVPVSASMPACGNTCDNNPAQDLAVEYDEDCTVAILTWNEPDAKKSGSVTIAPPYYVPGDVPAKRREGYSATRSKTTNAPFAPVEETASKAVWDLLWHFRVGEVQGDGGNFSPFMWEDKLYVSKWNANIHGLGNVSRFVKNGSNWVYDGNINISGLTNMWGLNIEGFCTDGEFIYGATGGSIIWKIDPATWTATNFVNVSGQYIDAVAYDVDDDCFWIAEFETNTVRKVSKAGTILKTLNSPNLITDIAWENTSDGTPYLWMLSGDNLNLHRWNLTTDAYQANAKTTSDVPGLSSVATAGAGLFTGLDITTGKMVMIGICEGSSLDPIFCYELGDGGEMCETISDLAVTVSGYTVDLTWTAAPGAPTGYQVIRNGAILNTVTATSYTNNYVPDGIYTYGVKALFAEDCFPKTVNHAPIIVGDMCIVEVVITDVVWGDGYSWTLTDDNSGAILMGGGRQAPGGNNVATGTYTLVITNNATFTIWHHQYSDNGVSLYVNFNGTEILEVTQYGISAGFFHTVGIGCDIKHYNVYRDNSRIAENITSTFFMDHTYDPDAAHTWAVKVACQGGETEPVTAFMGACNGDCPGITNLQGEYTLYCDMVLTWDAPVGKRAPKAVYVAPEYIHVEATEAELAQEGAKHEQEMLDVNTIEDGAPELGSTIVKAGGCDNIIIGTATTSAGELPVRTYWNFSYTQQIFDEADLEPGLITEISFQYIDNTVRPLTNQEIRLGHTTKSTFANATDYVAWSSLTEVFTGTITYNNSNEWFTIVLDEPFLYEGGNLVLAYLHTHGANHGSASTFRYHTTTGNKSLHHYHDSGGPINPNNPQGVLQGVQARRSNTKFTVCPAVAPGAYNIYRDGELIGSNVKETTFTDVSIPDPTVPYTWAVEVICAEGGFSKPVKMTKEACACDTPPVTNLEGEFDKDCSIFLTWDAPSKSIKSTTTPELVIPVYKNMEPSCPVKEAERIAMEEKTVFTASAARTNPNVAIGHQEFPKGLGSDVIINVGSGGTCYKGTVANPFGSQIGSSGRSIQASEYINGVLYAAGWAAGAPQFGTINQSTGAWTPIKTGFACDAVSLCWNPVTNLVYVTPWTNTDSDGPVFGTVNLATGDVTTITTFPLNASHVNTFFMAIDNDGVAYAIRNMTNQFGTINLATGAFTQIATLGGGVTQVNYIQPLFVDRETNELYWIAQTNLSSTTYFRINKATGALTQITTGTLNPSAGSSITEAMIGDPCPAITNLTATQGSGQSVNLTWTAASGATSYEVSCDGTLLATVTTTSYTHASAATGSRNYCVKAIYPPAADCIPQSVCQSVMVSEDLGGCAGVPVILGTTNIQAGPVNTLWEHGYTQVIYTADEIGDPGMIEAIAYNWTLAADRMYPITVWIGHTTKNEFTGATAADFVPLSEMQQVFNGNMTFSSANLWSNIDLNDAFEYQGGNIVVAVLQNSNTYTPGQNGFTTGSLNSTNKYINTYSIGTPINPNNITTSIARISTRPNIRFKMCAGVTYNVYFGNELLTPTPITVTNFHHSGFDNTVENTWCIKVVCEEGSESLPVCITKDPCIPCQPAENLTAVYNDDCCALLEWEAPLFKVKTTSPVVITQQVNEFDRTAKGQIINNTPSENTKITVSPAPKGMVNVTLVAYDVWDDGTGFQLLLDNTGTQYGVTIPATGAAVGSFGGTTCAVPATLYDVFSHKNPVAANPSCTSTNIVWNGSTTIQIPAGTYDWGIANPTPGSRIWRVGAGGGAATSGARQAYVFQDGLDYTFHVQLFPSGNDGVVITTEQAVGGSYVYNIYRDDVLIAANHSETTYMDCGFDPFVEYTWTVTQACQQAEFGESDPISVSLLACACHPPQNFNAQYTSSECEGVILSWDLPIKPIKTKANPIAPVFEEFVTDAHVTYTEKADKGNEIPAGNMVRKATTPIIVKENIVIGDIPRAPKGMVNVTLAANDVWGDMTGYQLLLDQTATQYGNTIPTTGPLTTTCNPPSTLYNVFSHLIPTNAVPTCTSPVVAVGSVTIQIPAGTYDWCIANPDPGWGRIWIAGDGGGPQTIGRRDNYVFEEGLDYLFTMQYWATTDGDGVVITTEAAGEPCAALTNLNVAVVNNNNVALTWTAAPGTPTGYEIRFNNALLATVTGTSYTHTNVNAGTHNYCVRAMFAGDCVPQSVCQSVTVNEYFGNCEAIVIGTGTTAVNTLPLNTFWHRSYTQQIFEESEIGEPGLITNIAFNYIKSPPNTYAHTNQTIYLAHTTKNTFASTTDWVPFSEFTQVFTGTITYNNEAPWFNIQLDEPFEYEGGNLVLVYLNNHGGYLNSTNTFHVHATSGAKAIHFRADDIPPINPAAPPTASGTLSQRNNVRFVVCPNIGLYNIYRDGNPIQLNWPELTYTDYAVDGMNPFEYHCWTITAVCTGDGLSESAPVGACLVACKDTTEYLVFGVVAAADGNFITGAALNLENMHLDYNTQSVELGRFEFDPTNGVYKTTYTLTITKPGYQIHTQEVVVIGHTNLGTIILYDIPYPPTGVVAEILDENSSIVEWQLPATLPLSVGGIIGYKVWRFLEADQDNPSKWHILTNNPINAMSHTDFGWAGLAAGTYMYAVATCYHGNVVSEPEFSNTIEKKIFVPFTIAITTNSGDSPIGAYVMLTHTNGTSYTATATENSVLFPEVETGDYELLITLERFYDYTAEFTIDITGAHHALLIEILTAPIIIGVDTIACKALFTWDAGKNGNSKSFKGYNVYLDGALQATGIQETEYLFELPTGTYTAGVQAIYSSGNSEISETEFTIDCVGIVDYEMDYNIYPNPATDKIIVERANSNHATIEIYSATGAHINKYETIEAKFEINVVTLSAGTYFIKVTEGDRTSTKSFVKN